MKNKLFLNLLIAVFILFVFSPYGFSYICANGAGGGYGGGSGEAAAGGDIIENYIIEGGAYFLKACSGISLFLNKVELSTLNGVDYAGLNALAVSAADDMKSANAAYENVLQLAETTPYNEAVVTALKSFNYKAFLNEKGLIPVVFNEAADYLKKGDITGALKKLQRQFVEISVLLETIKVETAAGAAPGLESLWLLNGKCCRALLFGQYTAEIFADIDK